MTEQLQLDRDDVRSLADRLERRDRYCLASGAERLLVALVRRGLDEDALMAAALLVELLDQPASPNGRRAAA